MRSFVASLVLSFGLSACSFNGGGVQNDDDDTIDASIPNPIDSSIDGGCGGEGLPFAPTNVDACAIPTPIGDFSFPTGGSIAIDTTAGTVRHDGEAIPGIATALVTQLDGVEPAMVIAATNLTVPAGVTVRVTGSRPLILVAIDVLTIDGTIDAAGIGVVAGPGADLACATGAATAGTLDDDTNAHLGGTGASGGGYGTAGGDGGAVSPGGDVTVEGGGGWGNVNLVPLVGGCSGGNGGTVGDAAPARGGGAGGGLELIAGQSIVVNANGIVTVSGGGGIGATATSGGGGSGGSGGSILFQAVGVTVTGAITANGGAGAEGRRDTQNGDQGDDGRRAKPEAALAATGGSGSAGGNGGDGAVLAVDGANGQGGTSPAVSAATGGGGGGGGAGRIHVDATTSNFVGGVFSPLPQ